MSRGQTVATFDMAAPVPTFHLPRLDVEGEETWDTGCGRDMAGHPGAVFMRSDDAVKVGQICGRCAVARAGREVGG